MAQTPIARAAGLQKMGLTFGNKSQGQWSKTAKGVKPTKFAQSKWDQAEAFRARLNNDLIDLENKLTVWSPLSSPFHCKGHYGACGNLTMHCPDQALVLRNRQYKITAQ